MNHESQGSHTLRIKFEDLKVKRKFLVYGTFTQLLGPPANPRQKFVTGTPVKASMILSTIQASIKKPIPKTAQRAVCLADCKFFGSPAEVKNLNPPTNSIIVRTIKANVTDSPIALRINSCNCWAPAGPGPRSIKKPYLAVEGIFLLSKAGKTRFVK